MHFAPSSLHASLSSTICKKMKKINTTLNLLLIVCFAVGAVYFTKQSNQIELENKQQEEMISGIMKALKQVEANLKQTTDLTNQAEVDLSHLRKKMTDSHTLVKNMSSQFQIFEKKVSSLNRFESDSIKTKHFALLSKEGKERIVMKSYPTRTFMMLKGDDGLNSIYFNVHDDGRQSISFRGTDGRAQIGIKTNENEVPEITVWKGGSFTLRSANGHHEIVKITESDDQPEVAFFEAVCNGSKVWSTNDWWLDRPAPEEKEADPVDRGQ
jgi:hypothetical protein